MLKLASKLHLDFETRSRVDIKRHGVDRYAREAEVLMLAWAFDDEEPEIWTPGLDLTTDVVATPHMPMPERLWLGLHNPHVTLHAWKARFERAIFRHALDMHFPIVRWRDPSILARHATIPDSLDGASKYLNLGSDAKMAKEGKRLIAKFSCPVRTGKRKGEFNRPEDHPEDWLLYQKYCMNDLRAERKVENLLEPLFELTPFEQRVAMIDAEINETGMPVDMQFVEEAQKLVTAEKLNLFQHMQQITGLANPNSGAQLIPWLQRNGYPFSSITKSRVAEALTIPKSAACFDVLRLRQQLSRSSTSKLDAFLDRTGPDNVLRHNYKYLGADKTGRWSGEGVQLQNFPR